MSFATVGDNILEYTGWNKRDTPLFVNNYHHVKGESNVLGNDKNPLSPALVFQDYNFTSGVIGDGIVCNGGNLAYNGTGITIENLKVLCGLESMAEAGLKIYATSDQFRPGEILLQNLRFFGLHDVGIGGGKIFLWNNAIYIDGSMLPVIGQAGIRAGTFFNVRCSGTIGPTIILQDCVHWHLCCVRIDPGKGRAELLINGGNNISSEGLIVNGALNIQGAATDCTISGSRLGDVTIGPNVRNLTLVGNCRSLTVQEGATGVFVGTVTGKKTLPPFNWFTPAKFICFTN